MVQYRSLIAGVFLLLIVTGISAQSNPLIQSEKHPLILNAWVRATAFETSLDIPAQHSRTDIHPATPTAAYMIIRNRAAIDIRLIAVETPVAGTVEIHETIVQNDVMRMSAVESIVIPAGEQVALQPGGLHLMLSDLEYDLAEGKAITIALEFEILDAAGQSTATFSQIIGAPVLEMPPDHEQSLLVHDAWARPTTTQEQAAAAMQPSHGHTHTTPSNIVPSAAYMMLINQTEEAVTIISATSTQAGRVELHTTSMEGDVMRMVELTEGISVPPGGQVELRPRGMHFMLMNLHADLLPGDALALTLELSDGTQMIIGVPVIEEFN